MLYSVMKDFFKTNSLKWIIAIELCIFLLILVLSVNIFVLLNFQNLGIVQQNQVPIELEPPANH